MEVGTWLEQNGEAIYGTRPWKIHAEGPEDKIHVKAGKHPKWVFGQCGPEHIRFTTKGDTLYAIALGFPEDGKLTIETLGNRTKIADGGIRNVTLLGSKAKLAWERTDGGLTVKLPAKRPNDIACALKIEVKGKLAK